MDIRTLIDSIKEWLHLKNKAAVEIVVEPPISAEIFSADQMERYGITLALSHKLSHKSNKSILLDRLSESEACLVSACHTLSEKTAANNIFSPAREWLLDNFYVVQEQIQSIRWHLPKGYGRSLPKLAGRISGYPRIYDIALQIIEHGDGRWALENLSRFITAYQGISPLTLGELWAIPITLGIALIETLSSASKRIVADRNDRHLAGLWADSMIETAVTDPKKLVIILADMARSEPQMNSAFVAELARRLQAASLSLPLSWVEQHLAEEGLVIGQLIQEENRRQAATQVTVSNCITGLRRLAEVDWRVFVEKMSVVEKTLLTDPIGIYGQMDFLTRDRYRHVVERLARTSLRSEEEVAQTAILLAQRTTNNFSVDDRLDPDNARYCHVGFYLIDKGLAQLEKTIDVHRSFWQKICHFAKKNALLCYTSCIFLITLGLMCLLLMKAHYDGVDHFWFTLLAITIGISGSQLAVALVNLVSTLLVKPKLLPRMDFSQGIPASFRTLVVIPSMLGSATVVDSLIEGLEVRFLGNKDKQLLFALLTDFNDAAKESMPEDADILALAQSRILALNKQYAEPGQDIFYLFHRPRQWNASEHIWMGRERKRGKLADLNYFLRGGDRKDFSLIVGSLAELENIKYVITLDCDTHLSRESARQFVGTMAHPLNRPRYDSKKQIVVEGYGILQPRLAEALPSSDSTRYLWLFGSEFGIDPYTRTTSDVYQDLFQEGSFVGKGIYDVDLFQKVLWERFPDNRILSHDLLEGCYLRSGLLSDVPLYERTPSSYLADTKRRSRWIRGDWQLIAWLFSWVSNAAGEKVINPLSLLSKLKLFDNLRRSLVPAALLLLLLINWSLLPETTFWLDIILAIILLPAIINTLLELLHKPRDMLTSQHIANIIPVMRRRAGQLLLYLACLPHEAWYSLSAISRTCWRMYISKEHFLEWTPFEQVERRLRNSAIEWLANMWMGPMFAILATLILLTNNRVASFLFALPLLGLWFFSPYIAYWLSQPIKDQEPKIDSNQALFLHRMARETWEFFETFINADNHWLPPDNYQEAPIEVLARRTSPTNIGLSLLASLTAYDFGYITMSELLERIHHTLETMTKMERYRGHFYNWYSTETLAPLLPRYISTVDSGNLAGHLLTLRQGLLALLDEPLLNMRYLDGVQDTWNVLKTKAIKSLPVSFSHFEEILQNTRHSFTDWTKAVSGCEELCLAAEKLIASSATRQDASMREIFDWSVKLLMQCRAVQNEIKIYADLPELKTNVTLQKLATKDECRERAKSVIALINRLMELSFSLSQMDVRFLYNEANHLMTIGFNVDDQRRDDSNYDLLSSEARLGVFVAIAQGQVPQESWFALGRLMVSSGGDPILLSWSGSMFEYLMPLLIMPAYPSTLLDQTYRTAVSRQIAYGNLRNVPWGVSESGYNAFDTQFNYLYRAFGVPGLGLKRGLEEDLVIAPYASAMALMVAPVMACDNLQRLAADRATGKFGFYEAIDYTLSRLPRESKRALIRSFMTHHQGMTFLSFSYLLHDKPMQRRFMADPLFQATLLLLQERIPKPNASYLKIPKSPEGSLVPKRSETSMRVFTNPNTRTPQVQMLSNGRYHVILTQAGGGYSRWKEFAVTRWREDSTCDNWGLFSYVRDMDTGAYCSTNYQPTASSEENFKAVFTEAHVDFYRSIMGLELHTEVAVSPEDDIELRRLRIYNRSKIRRRIEFTSYGEIVLAGQAADLSQPSFSNLFIQTELLPEQQAILATRRPRDDTQVPPWLCHLLNVYCDNPHTVSFETDRVRFIGRSRCASAPKAMLEPGDLSNTSGAVLDPIFAIRCQLTLEPDALVILDLLTGMTETRSQCVSLVEKYQDQHFSNRIFDLAWTHGQVLLHQLNTSEADAQLYGKLASAIIYTNNNRRADPRTLMSNRKGQSGLWGYSISGDLPIVLLIVEDAVNIELVRQLIQAQAYWRYKGLEVDLVILNRERVSYRQTLQDQIMSLITTNTTGEKRGCIEVRLAEQVPTEDFILLKSVARVILTDKRGSLKEQLSYRRITPPTMPLLKRNKRAGNWTTNKLPEMPKDLQFFNGLGGFSNAGDEYVIRLASEVTTPAPWVNVIANPNFGTLVSESGQGYTWIENAHEFRLTPWDNDPIEDSAGEAFYLRDDETGLFWSPCPLPCRGYGDYHIRHGFGYSIFEHIEEGIYSELSITVALDAPIKFAILKIRNDTLDRRHLSATGYVAWVLGELSAKNAMHIVTEISPNGTLFAQNHYNIEFAEYRAFFDATTSHIGLKSRTVTGDRAEFIGRNGSLQKPQALQRRRLSDRVGAGLDPCAAIQLSFDLAEGESREIVFILGAGRNKQEADHCLLHYHGNLAAEGALESVRKYWQKILKKITIHTPDPALNLLANGWLLYQMLSSRLWGRSGYYQSGGAFGFRDQLQDVMALPQIAPELYRAHLLLFATHQFEEGDVQHWWHPPHNRGLRSRCSDDFLWLPLAIAHYIETTGDMTILDEALHSLEGRPLKPDEESYYDLPNISSEEISLYQHAVRAIRHGLKFGEHGLPLMGSGDWNDGMNLVGIHGKGESVWLGFFLYKVLTCFSGLAARYGDTAFADTCVAEAEKLQQQLENHAWDGNWYRRAYFDDGAALGSVNNSECRIDSIAQSWSVISGAADPLRGKKAMNSLYQYLVKLDEGGLIKLLDPPFDQSKPSPGYIQGYVPGIRENGGQYTHGAVWATIAFAELGETQLAWELFQILNPINHGRNSNEVNRYKIEPYVVAGDIYSVKPHVGRGGWSWYTGSAGWLYRLITETLLGIRLEEGKRLRLVPLLPEEWEGFNLEYYYSNHHGNGNGTYELENGNGHNDGNGNTLYKITVKRTKEKSSLILDDVVLSGNVIDLQDDERVHQVVLNVGPQDEVETSE